MFPAFLLTVSTPSATIHCAGDLSCTHTHWSRFLPSNNIIASEEAAPLAAPGLTTFGTGCQTSVSSGFALFSDVGACCAKARLPRSIVNAKNTENRLRIVVTQMGFRVGSGRSVILSEAKDLWTLLVA